MLKQFSVIFIIYFLGEVMQKASGLPVPGNVLGMFLLFFGLLTGIVKLTSVDKISNFLLDNLAFFFLPAGVSVITSFALLEGKWTEVFLVSFISTIIALAVTGLTVEFVKKFIVKNQGNEALLGNKILEILKAKLLGQ